MRNAFPEGGAENIAWLDPSLPCTGNDSLYKIETPDEQAEAVSEGTTPAYILSASQRRYIKIKQAADFLLALCSLIILAIPMILIAGAVKISSPKEPVLFKHQRIGKDGVPFTLTKFRSMKSCAPQYIAAGHFPDSEEYVTPLGHFLRVTSLDELPQLFQVLAGKMSLIGPRPLIPQEERVHTLRRKAGVYQLRPGLTGWAQVNGRDRLTASQKAAYDREYLENISLAMDLKILCKTVTVLLTRNGAK